MKKLFCSSLRRFAIPSMIFALLAGAARADTLTTLDVSGTASGTSGQSCGSNCAFSGTLTADLAGNAVTAVDINFPGLPAFASNFFFISTTTGELHLVVHNSTPGAVLDMFFTTMPNPGTILDLTSGTITGGTVMDPLGDYTIKSGSITPVPEPRSLFLLGLALVAAVAFRRNQIFRRPSARL
jgi:PEP-CTERM motif